MQSFKKALKRNYFILQSAFTQYFLLFFKVSESHKLIYKIYDSYGYIAVTLIGALLKHQMMRK